ncbi:MAG: hypothetical protein M0R80_08190 [Proteobacteria bacterium]|jgi:hypothetical protein|nr:hypothetical protein [Pseudomonadota bacterium]
MKYFNEWLQLRESMNVYIQDYDSQNDVNDLYELGDHLARKITRPLWEKLTPEEQKAVRDGGSMYHQTITLDGNGEQLSFYPAGWPEPMVKTILQAIKYYLDEMGVEYAPFKKEQSGAFKGEVYRVPILKFSGPQDAPPPLNLANANARVIFSDLLKYPDNDGGFFDIDVRELLMRIQQVERDQTELHQRDPYSVTQHGGATMHVGGLSANGIEQRLAVLKQICQWAIAHHYDKIYAA